MEAVVRPPEATDTGPRLLLELRPERRGRAWVLSLLVHAAGLAVLLSIPATVLHSPQGAFHTATTLIAPPITMTQKAPNRGRVGKEFTLENLMPPQPAQPPPGLPPVARTPLRAPVLPPSRRKAAVPELEPPKLDSTGPLLAQSPPLGAPAAQAPPPPQLQAEEKMPKLVFETLGAPSGGPTPGGLAPGRLRVPSGSVTEATRAAIHSGSGGLVVGDADLPGSGGLGGALDLPTAPGRRATALEMLSDPMGVDFKPYLIQILAAVKRNWLAVIPESARLGRAGKVLIQFAIARDGHVPKLVIAMPSGTDALDRAAVAGVSASNPFPPLPAAFTGGQIRLQFTFLYNLR